MKAKHVLLFCCTLLTACSTPHPCEGSIGDPYSLVLIPQADGENIRYRYDADGSCNLQLRSMRTDSPGLTVQEHTLTAKPGAHGTLELSCAVETQRHSVTVPTNQVSTRSIDGIEFTFRPVRLIEDEERMLEISWEPPANFPERVAGINTHCNLFSHCMLSCRYTNGKHCEVHRSYDKSQIEVNVWLWDKPNTYTVDFRAGAADEPKVLLLPGYEKKRAELNSARSQPIPH